MDSVPLDSYGDEQYRLSTGYLENMYANAMAVTDKTGNTILFITCDASWTSRPLAERIRLALANEFGMPPENVILTGTHTHSGVTFRLTSNLNQTRYNEDYVAKMIEAGQMAMADRKSAQMFIGSARAEGLNFVRRYELLDGTYPNYQTVDESLIKCHESEPDDTLQLLKFVRDDGKDVVVYNWQAHLNMVSHNPAKYYLASADYFGPFRTEVEKLLDVHCFIWNGACGNLNPISQITSENKTADHREYGALLAQHAVEAYNNAVPVQAGEVKVSETLYKGQVNHEFDAVVAKAVELRDYYERTKDDAGVRAKGKPYGINTIKHVYAIISNYDREETENLPMKVACIGSVGFIVLYYEMFDTNGMYIKENSPFDMTFIVGYSESYGLGYIPSALVEDHGGYEVDNNIFVLGTGEIVADKYLDMLNELAGAE